jgi:hypothetical protein
MGTTRGERRENQTPSPAMGESDTTCPASVPMSDTFATLREQGGHPRIHRAYYHGLSRKELLRQGVST